MRRLKEAIKLTAYLVVVAVGLMTLWQGLTGTQTAEPERVCYAVPAGVPAYQTPCERPGPQGTLRLPPCDDDAPGAPITGPCWLADDDMVAVWPYPYADTATAILEGSRP